MAPALPLQQHPQFGAALRALGRHVTMIETDHSAPILCLHRFGLRFAPRGPIWTGAPDAQTLRQSQLTVINSEDDSPHAAGYRQIMTPAHVAELDLRGTPEERLAKARGKWRNSLRQAWGRRLSFHRARFDAARHGWLLEADRRQQRQKSFRALPHSLIHTYAGVSPGDVIVYTAKARDDIVAAMLFLRHAPVATYHIGWTSNTGRAARAHHALLFHAAGSFASDGCARLDLGTVDTETAPDLARFKIGSGADVRALGGTWLRVPGF